VWPKIFLAVGGLYGLLGVALGAFGAHGLRDRLDPSQLSSWQTAVQYQLVHGLALLVVGVWLLQTGAEALRYAGAFFAVGVALFSGSIYILVLTSASWLGPVTPFGGLFLMVGWLAVIYAGVFLQQ
jgi:uncharacterized membrane protein YgdD (TMEM256/DUF423 family)